MSKKNSSIKMNFIYNMIYQISLVILPLITAPYLARVIGSTGTGIYSFAYSVAYYFVLFAMLGINNYGNRSIAAVREDQEKRNYTFSKIYYFQLIVSLMSVIAYLLYCLFGNPPRTDIALIETAYVISAMFDINWFFFGLEEFKVTVVRKTAIKLVTTLCIFIFVRSAKDLPLYALIMAVSELIGQVYLWFYLPKHVNFTKVKLAAIFGESKKIIVLFIPVVATSIYRYMDKIMVGQMGSMFELGQYEYAEKIIMVCLGCMTALGTVMLPKMANLYASQQYKKVKKYLRESMQFAMFMSAAIAFGLASVSARLVLLYFGNEYELCGKIMFFLAPTVLPIAWANVIRTQFLIPTEKDKEYVSSVVVGAIVNFVVNFLLIPKYNSMGAVIGTICAEFTVAILQTIAVRKQLEIKYYLKNAIPYLVSGMVMYIVVEIIGKLTINNLLGLLAQIIIGGIVYLAITLGFGYVTKNSLYTTVSELIWKFGRR